MVKDKKTTRTLSPFLKTLKSVTLKQKLSFEKILKGIRNEILYGFLIVDIHTANELKAKFKDFPLIIKKKSHYLQDTGFYLKNMAEEHDLLKSRKNI